MMPQAMITSTTDVYPTPPALFARLARRYGPFDVDVCALPDNAKCARYFTPEVDGLKQQWIGCCWCNPPYGRTIGQWVRKAWEASVEGATVVCLLPARTDARWWQDYVLRYATKIEFLRGRVRFVGCTNSAPFPSAVVVFKPATMYQCESCKQPFRPARADSKFCGGACRQAAYRARRVTAISVTAEPADNAHKRL
jgi:phage N-6-adenine-methyltransferase